MAFGETGLCISISSSLFVYPCTFGIDVFNCMALEIMYSFYHLNRPSHLMDFSSCLVRYVKYTLTNHRASGSFCLSDPCWLIQTPLLCACPENALREFIGFKMAIDSVLKSHRFQNSKTVSVRRILVCGPICLLQKMGKQSKIKKQRLYQRKCCTELAHTLVARDSDRVF